MNKSQILIIASILGILLLVIIYSMVVFGGNKEVKYIQDFEKPTMKKDYKSEYKSRIDRIKNTRYNKEEENVKAAEFKIYSTEEGVELENEIKPENKTTTITTKSKPDSKMPRSIQTYSKKKSSPVTNTQKQSSTIDNQIDIPVVSKQEYDEYNSFGVTVSSAKNNENTNIEELSLNKYIEAFTLEDKKIKSNTQLTFILNENTTISGIRFRRMSRIFAVAVYNNGNVDIIGNVIQNTDGKEYSINLIGYNENFQKGIYRDSDNEEDINKAKDGVIDNLHYAPSVEAELITQAINAGQQGAKEIIKKDPEIFISKGYKMYFKYDNN